MIGLIPFLPEAACGLCSSAVCIGHAALQGRETRFDVFQFYCF